MTDIAGAYSATGAAWQQGPGRVYDRLAEVVVAACPGGVAGRQVLDVGAGTGAGSRAARRAGATDVVAVDAAIGMLAHDADRRPPAAVGEAERLPFAAAAFGAVVAAFSLNHLTDPGAGLAEAARVLEPGGGLVASAYAADDDHPAKAAVDQACRQHGWTPPPWYGSLRDDAMPRLATVAAAEAAAEAAGLTADVQRRRVPFPELGPDDLVAWRMGMAHVAPFLAGVGADDRERIRSDALDQLGADPPPLVRSIVVLRVAA